MSKRKRSDELTENDGTARAQDYRKQRQIFDTFAKSAARLAQAFKLGKGFERQKLGRRKKNAAKEKNEAELQRIDNEVSALKTLDATSSAQNYLAKSLLKIKSVASAPDLPEQISKPRALPANPAMLNVHARLCNSNPVKEAFPTALAEVKREFGIVDSVPIAKRRLRAIDYNPTKDVRARSRNDIARSDEDGNEEDESDNDNDNDTSDGSGETYSVEDASDLEIEGLEQRLAEESLSRRRPQEQCSRRSSDAKLSGSDSEADSEPRERKKAGAPNKSSFIPALTMGGYISGSGSDIEEIADMKPHKNRRGQRARQAIWEKKFGSGAKHLRDQGVKEGWSSKRDAESGNGGSKAGRRESRFAKDANKLPLGRSRLHSKAVVRSKPNSLVSKKGRRDDAGPLHPSWEAAKRAKEKKSVPVAFQGKRISFD